MRKIIFIVLVLININALSQTFNPGYILTGKKDSVSGYILDKTDKEMESKIEFKKSVRDNSSTVYTPNDLLGFGFNYGRIFERQTIVKETKDTLKVFAKRIIQGKINVYLNSNPRIEDQELFLKNNNLTKVVRLTRPKKEIRTQEDGTQYTFESNAYIGLLNQVTSDATNFKITNPNEKYSTNKILDRIRAYNNSFAEEYRTSKYIEQKKFSYDLTVGIPISRTANGTPYKSAFRVALYRTKSFPETTRRLSYINGFSYRYDSWTNVYNSTSSQHFLSLLPIGLNLHGSKGLIRPYAYVGLGLTFSRQPVYITDETSSAENPKIEQQFSLMPGFNVGTGVKIKIGSKFLNFEITPTGNNSGIFMNIGYTI